MDNITELVDLVKEQDFCKMSTESTVNINMEFSELESSYSMEEIDNISLKKVPDKEDHYQHSFSINKSSYKYIVDPNETILQKLRSETKTIIQVSKKKKSVVIIGSIPKQILHAKHKIDKLIENSKLQFTHFISIPTNSDEIKNNFITFKRDVKQNYSTEYTGFYERMFQKPEKLHLTISMLHLLDEKDEVKAIAALNTCKENIIDPIIKQNGPINLELKGLRCMEKDPSKARILYINVHEESGLFQKMSNSINDYFIEQGISRRVHDDVTLHMTVINILYLQRKTIKKTKNNFDATDFLKKYKNISFGKINLSTLHISMLTAKSADGYFKAMTKIYI
ncbi:activating signal cointegrator 1 complex subunit 1-like isoform X2 [Phymastichus coffea]|nr:activating signal cointegrator 1 complex subunit 1-like isoform X2 [Phymastichus coffea]